MVAEPSAAFALPSSLNNFTVPPVALRAVKTPKTALPTSTTVILTLGACKYFYNHCIKQKFEIPTFSRKLLILVKKWYMTEKQLCIGPFLISFVVPWAPGPVPLLVQNCFAQPLRNTRKGPRFWEWPRALGAL